MSEAGIGGGQKIGGLEPIYWVGIVGAIGVFYFVSHRKSASAGPPIIMDNTSPQPGVGVGGGGSGGWSYQPTIAPPPPPAITTNDAWRQEVTNGLIAMNYDASLADSAIRDYLAVKPLTPQEQTLVTIALGKWGSPPGGLGPAGGLPAVQTPIGVPGTPVLPPPAPVVADVPRPYLWPWAQGLVDNFQGTNAGISDWAAGAESWTKNVPQLQPATDWLTQVADWFGGTTTPSHRIPAGG